MLLVMCFHRPALGVGQWGLGGAGGVSTPSKRLLLPCGVLTFHPVRKNLPIAPVQTGQLILAEVRNGVGLCYLHYLRCPAQLQAEDLMPHCCKSQLYLSWKRDVYSCQGKRRFQSAFPPSSRSSGLGAVGLACLCLLWLFSSDLSRASVNPKQSQGSQSSSRRLKAGGDRKLFTACMQLLTSYIKGWLNAAVMCYRQGANLSCY